MKQEERETSQGRGRFRWWSDSAWARERETGRACGVRGLGEERAVVLSFLFLLLPCACGRGGDPSLILYSREEREGDGGTGGGATATTTTTINDREANACATRLGFLAHAAASSPPSDEMSSGEPAGPLAATTSPPVPVLFFPLFFSYLFSPPFDRCIFSLLSPVVFC